MGQFFLFNTSSSSQFFFMFVLRINSWDNNGRIYRIYYQTSKEQLYFFQEFKAALLWIYNSYCEGIKQMVIVILHLLKCYLSSVIMWVLRHGKVWKILKVYFIVDSLYHTLFWVM